MEGGLPPLYFRVRENGAVVFRVGTDHRHRRIELEQIAVANVRNGEIRPHAGSPPTPEEEAAIRAWIEARAATLARRELEDIHRTIDQLNLAAQWAQSRATEAQLAEVTDLLLLAMHDLRSVLVRRQAERLSRRAPGPEG